MTAKICFVVSAPMTAQFFLKDHIKALSERYEVYLAANFRGKEKLTLEGLSEAYDIEIERGINPIADIKAIIRLRLYFAKMKFDAIHSVTPKAGMISAIAGKLANIKNRIHIFTGQVWATKSGISKLILKSIDKIIVSLNNYSLVDGDGQRQFLISEKVLKKNNSKVLGEGSISGVNTIRFKPSEKWAKEIREECGISEEKIVFCLMGRFNREKGIYELFEAFNSLVATCPNSFLLLIGMDEEGCLDNISMYHNIKPGVNFKYFGKTNKPEYVLQAADVFCMPSYREGFGSSVIEAQCLGIPVICSDAYGLKDAMVDNVTGLRCKVKNVESLKNCMSTLYNNQLLRLEFGKNGRERILTHFSGNEITREWVSFYNTVLNKD